jgi:hypothetical protein
MSCDTPTNHQWEEEDPRRRSGFGRRRQIINGLPPQPRKEQLQDSCRQERLKVKSNGHAFVLKRAVNDLKGVKRPVE